MITTYQTTDGRMTRRVDDLILRGLPALMVVALLLLACAGQARAQTTIPLCVGGEQSAGAGYVVVTECGETAFAYGHGLLRDPITGADVPRNYLVLDEPAVATQICADGKIWFYSSSRASNEVIRQLGERLTRETGDPPSKTQLDIQYYRHITTNVCDVLTLGTIWEDVR